MEILGEAMGASLVNRCCSLAMKAHHSSTTAHFLLDTIPSSPTTTTTIFAFPASWSAADWLNDGDTPPSPFADSYTDPSLFPSLRTIGSAIPARANAAFLRSFRSILTHSRLQAEVTTALSHNRRIVFTGHSSGGPISSLATIWLLEKLHSVHTLPICVTFGSPLLGDPVFSHALRREGWSARFLHFIISNDIVPRIHLSPVASLKQDLQAVLHFLCPDTTISNPQMVTLVPTQFYTAVLRSTLSASSRRACQIMGCSNPLLQVLSNGGFIGISPYRPFGSYAILTSGTSILHHASNSDSALQLLFYYLQPHLQDVNSAARTSLEAHLMYETVIRDHFSGVLGLEPEVQLGEEARLSIRAAEEWEERRWKNQDLIDGNKSKITEALDFIDKYRGACEIRGVGYYDAFRLQREEEDFQANVKRLELAGQWDEIVEMLRREELPDGFEGRGEWVSLGTRYRRLVEPLDIANYYRHAKNEDTGPYLEKGRPKRYVYAQRWMEKAEGVAAGSGRESCFWAAVEELCSGGGGGFEGVSERVADVEEDVERWVGNGRLGRDVLLEESMFVKWWKTLPKQHRMVSRIARLVEGGDSEMM